jgi:hypothetical protein
MIGFNATSTLPQNFQVNWLGTSVCALWLLATHGITLNSGTISQWNDLSGNSNNATQGVADIQPTYVLNDSPYSSVEFICNSADTTYNALSIASANSLNSGTGSYHMWAVIRTPSSFPATHTIHGPIFDKNSTSPWTGAIANGFGMGFNISGSQAIPCGVISGQTGLIQNVSELINTSTLILFECYYDGTNFSMLVNGIVVFGPTAAAISTNTNTNALVIGVVQAVGDRGLSGNIFECGINVPAPSANQRLEIQNYAKGKYGV